MFPSDGVGSPNQSQQPHPGAWPHLQDLLHRYGKVITCRFQHLGLLSLCELKRTLPEIKPSTFVTWILLPFLELLHDPKPMTLYRVCLLASKAVCGLPDFPRLSSSLLCVCPWYWVAKGTVCAAPATPPPFLMTVISL